MTYNRGRRCAHISKSVNSSFVCNKCKQDGHGLCIEEQSSESDVEELSQKPTASLCNSNAGRSLWSQASTTSESSRLILDEFRHPSVVDRNFFLAKWPLVIRTHRPVTRSASAQRGLLLDLSQWKQRWKIFSLTCATVPAILFVNFCRHWKSLVAALLVAVCIVLGVWWSIYNSKMIAEVLHYSLQRVSSLSQRQRYIGGDESIDCSCSSLGPENAWLLDQSRHLLANHTQLLRELTTLRKQIQHYEAETTANNWHDYALEKEGTTVSAGPATEIFDLGVETVCLFGLYCKSYLPKPKRLLQDRLPADECWPFAGSKGSLLFRFTIPVRVTGLGYQHFPLRPDPRMSAAPMVMDLYGVDEAKEDGMNLVQLISVNYSAELLGQRKQWHNALSKLPQQQQPFWSQLMLFIRSNHGRAKFTCLYHISIYGQTQV